MYDDLSEGSETIGWFVFFGIVLIFFAAFSDKEDRKVDTLNNRYFQEQSASEPVEMGNPYNYDSGHSAGYEWAEETGGNCTTASASFNEGCEEYYYQEADAGY